ncbi:MAG: YncE family protein [Actinomycetota bacterium]
MFRFHPLAPSGARLRLWIAVATVAVLLATAAPVQAAQSAYVTVANSVHQYDIVAGGLLVPMVPAKVPTGESPTAMAVSPDFESLYAANEDGASVSQYDIGRDGALSPKSPAKLATGFSPQGVAVSPDGQSVYVSLAGPANVAQYDVGPGGELSPKSPATVAAGGTAYGVAVSPDGQSVYVTDYTLPNVWQYDVGTGGELSPKSPATVSYFGDGARGIAVGQDGESVYVANSFGRSSDVWQYDVGPGGALAPKSPATVAAGGDSAGVAVSPDGQSVYVANQMEASVSQYHVGAGGWLAPMAPATVAAHEGSYGVGVSPDGESVYVANRGNDSEACLGNPGACGNVSQYDVGPGGKLSPKSPAKVATGTGGGAVGVAVSPGRVPTTKKQCKRGGWKQWGFKKRGRCIPFVKRNARHSCLAARKVIGRHAFRQKYSKGKHHRLAMRRCFRQEIRAR